MKLNEFNNTFQTEKQCLAYIASLKQSKCGEKSVKKLTIDTQTIANPYNNDYNYMNYYGLTTRIASSEIHDNFPLTLPESQKFINNSTDFNKDWKPIVTARENNFVSRLKEWEIKNNVQISDNKNVFVFCEYQTRNWKINGLEIKPLIFQYYITSNDTTRARNTSESLKILENLFVGPDALFKYNKNYMIGKNFYNFNIELNPDIYDNFMKNDVTIQKVYEYVTQQTKDFLTKDSFIKPTDKVQWTANNTDDWLNTSIKKCTSKRFFFSKFSLNH
ncbi:hypothetical protein [Spiroplasma endosymbiont of Virgichneumon dumeticola]|uniref:hypothetical protein n=1 Tax=Spiroplasma endosymbiont of Virgichneumon dumeticola TaxID=3139323 RepID=UPI0035C8C43A